MKTHARTWVCSLVQAAVLILPAHAARTEVESIGVMGAVSKPAPESQAPAVPEVDWWTGFEEEPLNRFVQMLAASGVPATDGVALYLTFRIQQLRLAVLQQNKAALLKERQAIAQRPPRQELASWLAETDRRLVALDALQQTLSQERIDTVRTMLHLAGGTEEARAVIHLAASASGVPRFMRDVPSRLPASVLASRPEVAFAARTSTQRLAMPELLAGWVDMAPSPAPLMLQSVHEEQPLRAVVGQAAHDVGWGLRLLGQSANQVPLQSRRLDAAKLELEAIEARASIGDADPSAAPRALQNVLVQADALILAYGRLALAWIDLHRKAPSTMAHISSAETTD